MVVKNTISLNHNMLTKVKVLDKLNMVDDDNDVLTPWVKVFRIVP